MRLLLVPLLLLLLLHFHVTTVTNYSLFPRFSCPVGRETLCPTGTLPAPLLSSTRTLGHSSGVLFRFLYVWSLGLRGFQTSRVTARSSVIGFRTVGFGGFRWQ